MLAETVRSGSSRAAPRNARCYVAWRRASSTPTPGSSWPPAATHERVSRRGCPRDPQVLVRHPVTDAPGPRGGRPADAGSADDAVGAERGRVPFAAGRCTRRRLTVA